jgi:hypothetical protein
MYDYRRMLPHHQKFDKALFVTFCKNNREPFAAEARDAILECCLKGNNYRFRLHAAVVMPGHVHRKRLALQAAGNFEITQGSVCPICQQDSRHLRPGLARGILRSCLAFPREFAGKAGVYSAKSRPTWSGEETRRLPLALGGARTPWVRKCGWVWVGVGRTFLSDAVDLGLDLDLDSDFSQAAIKASDVPLPLRTPLAVQVRKPLISSIT